MFIQLARAYKGHEADEIIEVEDLEGSDMIHYGTARRPSDYDVAAHVTQGMTKAELVTYAGEHGIAVDGKATKEDIASSISHALTTPPTPPDSPAPESTETPEV